jgi:hypothetical protein
MKGDIGKEGRAILVLKWSLKIGWEEVGRIYLAQNRDQ